MRQFLRISIIFLGLFGLLYYLSVTYDTFEVMNGAIEWKDIEGYSNFIILSLSIIASAIVRFLFNNIKN